MIVIARIAMKCPNIECFDPMVWTEYVSYISLSSFHLDHSWFRLIQYLINLQWDECYSNNCHEMSKYEDFDLKWFELGLLSYLINLQWDDCYSKNCDEMSKIEVSILFKMVWVRASVTTYKSSMRWLL